MSDSEILIALLQGKNASKIVGSVDKEDRHYLLWSVRERAEELLLQVKNLQSEYPESI